MSSAEEISNFDSFGLSQPLLKAVKSLGYETPSPIQQQCIPLLLNGDDIIGQAQTGTGKTAAFALPLLAKIDIKKNHPQLLVLAPTRELAIQVAEAIQSYARFMKGFHVLPVYGGQAYNLQLRPLKRGVHVVVGTPGRVMDHIRRGTLKLDGLNALVLDEADEMLRMGFIDDVKWVMEHIPEQRQIALFSATMPKEIRKVAEQFLNNPTVVKIQSKTTTAPTIRQRYWQVSGTNKLDALTRILEVETFDALLLFVRTKTATIELAEKLQARGFAAEAINGDISQNIRERTIGQLKRGKIDILVATDVAARGLDVERISHVINYDIPYDPESYVHRIGRTGRAGRSGEAILFVAPREKRLLKTIEKVTRQVIEPMQLPSAKDINEQRITAFKQKITDGLTNHRLDVFEKIIIEYHEESGVEPLQIAAVLAQLMQGQEPLLVTDKKSRQAGSEERKNRPVTNKQQRVKKKPIPLKKFPEVEMCRYKVEVGHQDQVKPGNILGAIANEAEIDSCYIGAIDIYDTFSTVDLPGGMPKETLKILKKARVCGKKLNILDINTPDHKSDPPKRTVKGKSTARTSERKRGPKSKDAAKKNKKSPRKKARSRKKTGND
jgi:ATP-dependent RNA helicase DeaD